MVSAWAGMETRHYDFGYVVDWSAKKDGPAMGKRVGGTILPTAGRPFHAGGRCAASHDLKGQGQ